MGASAFATGSTVGFAQSPDLHTAAHEAAHVVQQRGGVQLKDGVGRAGDTYERHADAVADRVVRGDSAEALLTQVAGSERSAAQPSTTAAMPTHPAVQRAPPPGTSAEKNPAQDAVDDHSGRLRQLADPRNPSNPNNKLGSREMYEIWKNQWSARQNQATQQLAGIKERLRSEDPVGYAQQKERFDAGIRNALGPDYEAAEDEMALCSAEISSVEEVRNWLEREEVQGRHVTLDEVNRHALDWATASAKHPLVAGIVQAASSIALLARIPGALWETETSPPSKAVPAVENTAIESSAAEGSAAKGGANAEGGAAPKKAAGPTAKGAAEAETGPPAKGAPQGEASAPAAGTSKGSKIEGAAAAEEWGAGGQTATATPPKGGVRAPAPRHRAASVKQNTYPADRNTLYDRSVDVDTDVRAINAGTGKLGRSDAGELTVTVNGRTYAVEPNGTLSPRTGSGFHTLTRAEFKALGVYNQFGESARAEEILTNMGIDPAQRARALEVWKLLQ